MSQWARLGRCANQSLRGLGTVSPTSVVWLPSTGLTSPTSVVCPPPQPFNWSYYMPGIDIPGDDYNVTNVAYSDPHICQVWGRGEGRLSARCGS